MNLFVSLWKTLQLHFIFVSRIVLLLLLLFDDQLNKNNNYRYDATNAETGGRGNAG